ncbi:MAG: bifunctional histidinol-phosphatase/imidazoleglycerol-phosphate dehydratase HisB [Pyrinomonadaceae bacterium]
MKRILFIDRDGTLIQEPPDTFQIDSFEKLKFVPGVITFLGKIAKETDFELVMVSNQDGLGTDSLPEKDFYPVHNLMLEIMAGEGIEFAEVLIDRSFPHENALTRKPGTALLAKYLSGEYDLANSFVIGDRTTDVQLARNLGAKAIFLKNYDSPDALDGEIVLLTDGWQQIYEFLKLPSRSVSKHRKTKETDVLVELNLDGFGNAEISTGLNFLDHMLEQIARHGNIDLRIKAAGDLHIDEHHTVEDVAITLGGAFDEALKDKRGMERYGFCLPMDDALAQVAIDFGGRNWLVWEADFKREKIGDVPTELFSHFFKSFTDHARCNLNVRATGTNEHHKIESIFKAFAKAIKMAVKRDANSDQLPSTKGSL